MTFHSGPRLLSEGFGGGAGGRGDLARILLILLLATSAATTTAQHNRGGSRSLQNPPFDGAARYSSSSPFHYSPADARGEEAFPEVKVPRGSLARGEEENRDVLVVSPSTSANTQSSASFRNREDVTIVTPSSVLPSSPPFSSSSAVGGQPRQISDRHRGDDDGPSGNRVEDEGEAAGRKSTKVSHSVSVISVKYSSSSSSSGNNGNDDAFVAPQSPFSTSATTKTTAEAPIRGADFEATSRQRTMMPGAGGEEDKVVGITAEEDGGFWESLLNGSGGGEEAESYAGIGGGTSYSPPLDINSASAHDADIHDEDNREPKAIGDEGSSSIEVVTVEDEVRPDEEEHTSIADETWEEEQVDNASNELISDTGVVQQSAEIAQIDSIEQASDNRDWSIKREEEVEEGGGETDSEEEEEREFYRMYNVTQQYHDIGHSSSIGEDFEEDPYEHDESETLMRALDHNTPAPGVTMEKDVELERPPASSRSPSPTSSLVDTSVVVGVAVGACLFLVLGTVGLILFVLYRERYWSLKPLTASLRGVTGSDCYASSDSGAGFASVSAAQPPSTASSSSATSSVHSREEDVFSFRGGSGVGGLFRPGSAAAGSVRGIATISSGVIGPESVGQVDCLGFDLSKDSFGEELYNLDNDSFLNSLETMAVPAHPSFWGGGGGGGGRRGKDFSNRDSDV